MNRCARNARPLATLLVLMSAFLPHAVRAEDPASTVPEAETLVRAAARPVSIRAGTAAMAELTLAVTPGWHINANPPALDYMIATEVEVAGRAGVTAGPARYPAPHRTRLSFEDSELLVYDGIATVKLPLSASAGALGGTHRLEGKVRFQACNDELCLPPTTIPFALEVTVTGAGAAMAAPGESARVTPAVEPPASLAGGLPPTGSDFSTAPPARAAAAVVQNPIGRMFDRNPALAYLSLFFIGLALNLTPCVYPMIGVTVSIFGARRAAPPHQVFGLAVLYVLGIVVMYCTLGLVAAFTGGLFGGFLQSPMVLIGIGVLLAVLSLSMFGLFEFQLPPTLLAKLGGTGATSAAGIFLSGLVVGVFAAPCIGPPIVALLAVVGTRADPWFGLSTLFVLSMGLGAPYLLLGTFSNLLQNLPRSGDWMVWVKKVFGVILLAVGTFYVLLALAPRWSGWVMPAALVVGGLYLGFERSAAARRGFRRLKLATGVLGVLAGVVFIVTTPSRGIAFQQFVPDQLAAAQAKGRPAMLDFTADWCVPCHELERTTFTDAKVIELARQFESYQVDLTRYDSPESDRWRRSYGITGVPTVIFLAADGQEVRAARVEGFLPPKRFAERMQAALEAAAVAEREP
jgi:thioredoxin:protein disulfide reductase